MKYIKQNKNRFYLLAAISGGVLALTGDILIGYMTPGSLGKYGFIQKGWSELTTWRISLSLFLAAIAFLLYLPGVNVIAKQISLTSPKTAKVFKISASGAMLGGTLIHTLFCAPMLVYKYLFNLGQAVEAIDLTYSVIFMMLPAAIITMTLMTVAFILIIVATIRNKTIYQKWTIPFNPLFIMLIVMSVKQIFPASALALAISTCCVNAALMSFFITALIYDLKMKKKEEIKAFAA